MIEEMRAYCRGTNGQVGLKVIVGRDNRENLLAYGRQFSGTVYFDEDGSAYSSLGANGVPAWIVLDDTRKVTAKYTGLLGGVPMDQVVDLMIDSKLNLGDFM